MLLRCALALAVISACNNNAAVSSAPSEPSALAPVVPTQPAAEAGEPATSAPAESAATSPAAAPSKPAVRKAEVALDIAPRNHAPGRPDAGWCAETAIQEALLYHGGFVPQRLINKAGKPRHPDLYWSDVPVAMKKLGLKYRKWRGDGDLDDFMDWIEEQIDAGYPVVAGVKIHPTEHPAWGLDHMVSIVGYDSGAALYINTTWGYQKRFTRTALSSAQEGIAFHNRSGRYFAYAVTELRGFVGQPVTLQLSGKSEGQSAHPAHVDIPALQAGQRYELIRYRPGRKRPTLVQSFTAAGPAQRLALAIDSTGSAIYRVRVASDS